jgi:hypothetical protein
VGPLPTPAGNTYCLTAVNHFTRWPEVVPILDITADNVARALLTGWISSFGCPQTITTNQGCQFESQLLHSLAKLCGFQLSWTTAHHRAANGLVQHFHWMRQAAIMCHADQYWTETLPLVLLRIHTAFKEDLQASVAELVYSEPPRIPGELLATFMHSDLEKCMHIFFHQDTMRRALQPPYSSPYQVLSWREKTLQLLLCGRPVTVSTNRVKPAYMLTRLTAVPPPPSTLAIAPPALPPTPITLTTRSAHHICFPASFNIWATISAGG